MTRPPPFSTPHDRSSLTEDTLLEEALRAAFSPVDLPPERHARLIDAALAEPLAEASPEELREASPEELREASPEELREAEAFRRALEGSGSHPNLALAAALRAAWKPDATSAETREERVPVYPIGAARSRRSRTGRLGVGLIATALAVAAAAALVVRRSPVTEPSVSAASLYRARSTAALFDHDFELGEASRRVDRIAAVRARELRSNRYSMWGVP